MNLLRKTLQLCLLIVLLPMNSGIAWAEFSKEARPSHMLNSQTVESGMEVSYLGNMVFALDRNTNLGTQGLFFLGGLPNLTLKHRMFDFENGSTTFNGFFMPIPKRLLEIGNSGGLTFFYSVTTGIDLNSQSTLSVGAGSTGYVETSLVSSGEGTAINFYHINFAYDLIISNVLSFNMGAVFFPFIDVDIESELLDARISGFNPTFKEIVPFFATATYSPENSSFNLEAGVWGVSPSSGLGPYLSLYWRLK